MRFGYSRWLVPVVAGALLIAFVDAAPWAFGQPTPTPTAPRIEFLNPTGGTSLEVSSKADGTDTTFHLVAWVDRVPDAPIVEFKYKPDQFGASEIAIGNPTLVGADTYELNWDMTGIGPEGSDDVSGGAITRGTSGTLKAILFSGASEVARDEETIRINQVTPPPCPPPDAGNNRACEDEAQGNTVELKYPTMGGSLGYYRPVPGQGPANSIFDVTSSEGTGNVQAYYTLSRPGSEPQWKPCKSGTGNATETNTNATDGVRCEYDSADDPSAVTAVAVRATDTHTSVMGTENNNVDAADAHRAFPYEQDVEVLELTPATQEAESGKCSSVITARVLDQATPRRRVADVNIDVHAAGPTDDLSFDDSNGTYSSANKPPEDHPTEPAIDCETTNDPPGSETQGDHDLPDESDKKHIESSGDTTDTGEWKFALFTRDQGATQFVVWTDEDGNDRLCSAEAQAAGSIGWNSAAPLPLGMAADESDCPRPAPTGPTPTASSVRPTTSTTPPTDQSDRTLLLAAEEEMPTAGDRVKLGGQLLAPQGGPPCLDGQFIRIMRRFHGTTSERSVATTLTDPRGRFQVSARVKDNADFRAIATAHDTCAEASSIPVTVEVRARVTLRTPDRTPTRFSTFKVHVTLTPEHPRTKVVLKRRIFGRWVKVASHELDRKSTAVFDVYAGYRRQILRAEWGGDRDHGDNVSNSLRVTSRRE